MIEILYSSQKVYLIFIIIINEGTLVYYSILYIAVVYLRAGWESVWGHIPPPHRDLILYTIQYVYNNMNIFVYIEYVCIIICIPPPVKNP